MKLFRRHGSSRSAPPRRRGDIEVVHDEPKTGTQFRRNQTLGQPQRAKQEESSRGRAHQLTSQRRKMSMALLVVAIAVTVMIVLLTQMIARVTVSQSSEQLSTAFDGAPYEERINEFMAKNPASRLRFALQEDALSQFVAASLPEVQSLKLRSMTDIVNGQFTITFRKPVASWSIDGMQYFVDSNGVVFGKNYYGTPPVAIIDEGGVRPENGESIASGRFLSFVGTVISLVEEGGYEVVEAIVPIDTTRQLDIKIKDVGPRIRLSIDRGAGGQVVDMKAALKHLSSKGIGAQYVDVRVAGRAVYR